MDRSIGRAQDQDGRNKQSTNNEWYIWSYRYKGDKHIDKLNVGPYINMYRGFKYSR